MMGSWCGKEDVALPLENVSGTTVLTVKLVNLYRTYAKLDDSPAPAGL